MSYLQVVAVCLTSTLDAVILLLTIGRHGRWTGDLGAGGVQKHHPGSPPRLGVVPMRGVVSLRQIWAPNRPLVSCDRSWPSNRRTRIGRTAPGLRQARNAPNNGMTIACGTAKTHAVTLGETAVGPAPPTVTATPPRPGGAFARWPQAHLGRPGRQEPARHREWMPITSTRPRSNADAAPIERTQTVRRP